MGLRSSLSLLRSRTFAALRFFPSFKIFFFLFAILLCGSLDNSNNAAFANAMTAAPAATDPERFVHSRSFATSRLLPSARLLTFLFAIILCTSLDTSSPGTMAFAMEGAAAAVDPGRGWFPGKNIHAICRRALILSSWVLTLGLRSGRLSASASSTTSKPASSGVVFFRLRPRPVSR